MSNESSPKQKDPFANAIVLFANNRTASFFWASATMVALGIAAISPYLTIQAMKQQEKVIILNRDSGTLLYTDSYAWADADELHSEMAIQIVQTLMDRSAAGPAYPQRFDTHLTENIKDKVKLFWQSNQDELIRKKIVQTFHFDRVRPFSPFTTNGFQFVDVAVNGKLRKTGQIDGVLFQEVEPLEINLRLMRNPDVAASGKMPLALYNFQIKQEDQPQGGQITLNSESEKPQ